MLLIAMAMAAAGPCNAQRAIDTSVSAILADPGRWMGRCVRITAPASRWQLFRGNRVPKKGSLRRGQIGAYWPDDMDVSDARIRSARAWTVIGEVWSCRRAYDDAMAELRAAPKEEQEGTIIMMRGYCHYFSGTTLKMVAAEPEQGLEG